MCQKILLYILNNKKLHWLERKMPNPYAVVHDKVDYTFALILILMLGLLFFFSKEIPCPVFLLEIFFIVFFLSSIRHIKTVPADIKHVITKSFICYQLILSSFLVVFGLVEVVNCLL